MKDYFGTRNKSLDCTGILIFQVSTLTGSTVATLASYSYTRMYQQHNNSTTVYHERFKAEKFHGKLYTQTFVKKLSLNPLYFLLKGLWDVYTACYS